ncbi:hypothetical protein [Paraburkholderia adhaesiva]|uniref:hypothetical protein n=1 Tax=Paraburkholderia adhaesiva TaxID=2883244 RepID=UPI001F35B4CE|nr:hypothetical protein [Paraburkholderia adhaesiva]
MTDITIRILGDLSQLNQVLLIAKHTGWSHAEILALPLAEFLFYVCTIVKADET